jgi:group I intron endonuclease
MLFALGFVFMFTIGGLLNNHLALPLLSDKTTICWEVLTIMILEFYSISVTKHNFEQSAGNLRILPYNIQAMALGCKMWGSSETKRSPRSSLREDIVRVKQDSLVLKYRAINIRYYSNIIYDDDNQDNTKNLKAEKVYENFKEDRIKIINEEKGRSGVYFLINKVNNHTYVGSSINLASRMRNYLNKAFLKSKQNINMPITKALLKYDPSNFSLLILEYVEPAFLTARETFYITHVMPYYNVLKQGYSSLGYVHTEETKKLLSELAKNRVHSDETKGLIARAVTGENNPFYNRNHSIESKLRMIEANSAYPVYIYNSFKELLVIFPSVKTLAKLIKSNHPTLVKNIQEQTIFRGE